MKKIGCLLFLCLSLISCTQNDHKEMETPDVGVDYNSLEFSEKFNSYLETSNFFTTQNEGSSWVETLKKIHEQLINGTEVEDIYLGNFMLGIDESVKVAVSYADKKPFLGEIDKRMSIFGKELINASTLLRQLEAYYKGKDYLNDNFKFANQLYSQFNAKQQKLDSLYIDLKKCLLNVKQKRDDYFINATKKEGQIARYYVLLSMKYTQEGFRLLNNKEEESTLFKDNFKLLQNAVDQLQILVSNDEAIKKSNILLKSNFHNYVNCLTSLKGNFRLLMQPNLNTERKEVVERELNKYFSVMLDDFNKI